MMSALPPKHLYSASVANQADFAVTIVATYSLDGEDDHVESHEVAPGATLQLAQRTASRGSYTVTAHISKIEAVADGKQPHAIAYPIVTGPTKELPIAVHLSGDALELKL